MFPIFLTGRKISAGRGSPGRKLFFLPLRKISFFKEQIPKIKLLIRFINFKFNGSFRHRYCLDFLFLSFFSGSFQFHSLCFFFLGIACIKFHFPGFCFYIVNIHAIQYPVHFGSVFCKYHNLVIDWFLFILNDDI